MATDSLDSMSLFIDEQEKRANTALILRVAKSDQYKRDLHARRHPDEKPTTTLVEDVVQHVRHWASDISEADIRKVMRGESL